MNTERNPQARQMGDESMVRNLAFQAAGDLAAGAGPVRSLWAGWPVRILDLGCGTGEITRRLAERYPEAEIVGIDILDGNLAIARRDNDGFAGRVRYETGDAFAFAFDALVRSGRLPTHVAGGTGFSAGAR